MRTENWCGYDIRFVEIDGEWWAILKDICDALKLSTRDVSQRIPAQYMERVKIDVDSTNLDFNRGLGADGSNVVSTHFRYVPEHIKNINKSMISRDLGRKPGDNKTRWMLAVNELGIYEALFASRKLEARKFRMWAGTVMQKLRTNVGLAGYEVMRMTEPEIQDQVDHILDTLFWDDEKKMLMRSVTVQGGDVEQVPFE